MLAAMGTDGHISTVRSQREMHAGAPLLSLFRTHQDSSLWHGTVHVLYDSTSIKPLRDMLGDGIS